MNRPTQQSNDVLSADPTFHDSNDSTPIRRSSADSNDSTPTSTISANDRDRSRLPFGGAKVRWLLGLVHRLSPLQVGVDKAERGASRPVASAVRRGQRRLLP
eukprot:3590346-Pyramimonas_sp.AAC.1